MALVKPIIGNIIAFDATSDEVINFVSSGGDTITANEIKIVTNDDNETVVYNNIITSTILSHTIPANTLTNGNYYKLAIRTYNTLNETSAWSDYRPFYCYTTPTLGFNILDGTTINSDSLDIQLIYNQIELEVCNFVNIKLYNPNGTLNYQLSIYNDGSTPPNIFYDTLTGLNNNTTYTLVGSVETINGTTVTESITFNVSYSSIDSQDLLETTIDNCSGAIQLKTVGIVSNINPTLELSSSIDTSNVDSYDPFINYNNGSLDLVSPTGEIENTDVDNAIWVSWKDFQLESDFMLYTALIPAKIGQPIIQLKNTNITTAYITVTCNRGVTQDYLSIRTSDGTIIDKGLGIYCNGGTRISLLIRVKNNNWYVSTTILDNYDSYVRWGVSNIFVNMTSDIAYENENYGNFEPNQTVEMSLTNIFDKIIISNGIFTDLHLSSNPFDIYSESSLSSILKIDFHYNYDNDILGTFYKIKLERAKLNSSEEIVGNWVTLTENNLVAGINYITFNDYYIPTSKQLYRLTAYYTDSDNQIATIVDDKIATLKWDYVFISDSNNTFRLRSGVIYSGGIQNIQNDYLMPIAATYPIVIQNAKGNYRSGSVQFTVLGYQFDIDSTLDRLSIVEQTNDILAFLTDGSAKCIKDYNGNIFICKIINSPQISYNANWGNGIPQISFNWVEQAKYDDTTAMTELGFYS